jgi:hypothetical protein
VNSPALRWLLAVVLTPALVAAGWWLGAGRGYLAPAPRPGPAERLSAVRISRTRKNRGLRITGTRRARGGRSSARAGVGLGARLVEDGRPRGPLRALDLKAHLPAPASKRQFDPRPGRQPVPGETGPARSGRRARAASAAAGSIPAKYAPGRRRIPPRSAGRADADRALRPGEQLPRLKLPASPQSAPTRSSPDAGKGGTVAPPAAPGRLPAPTVPLPLPD